MTDSIHVVFGSVNVQKERWMDEGAGLVDCIYFALSDGGLVDKEVVVG